ncbi:MAG: hypothetical protein IH892_10730 [Planctomycetes bacterium]|nr:hypothetical protein [Planctomycetota bacterium]
MMRVGDMTRWTLGLLLLGLLGCEKYVLSLHPLQTPANRAFEADLLGKWTGDGGVWEFAETEEGNYEVRVADLLSSGHFKGHLLRLGDDYYLDLTPTAPPAWPQTTGFFNAHFVATHTILQVDLAAPRLRLRRLKVDALKEMQEADPHSVSYVEDGDNLLLTGNSAALQAFVQAVSDNNDLWEAKADLERCSRLYQKGHIVSNDHFPGRWQDPNGILTVTAGERQCYDLRFLSQEEEAQELVFSGYLIEIKGLTLLGVFLEEPEDRTLPDWFALLALTDDELRFKVSSYADTEEILQNPEMATAALAEPDLVLRRRTLPGHASFIRPATGPQDN